MTGSCRLRFPGLLALLGPLLVGCPTTTDPPTKHRRTEPAQDDEWAGIQRTAEWLYVTRDFSGKRLDECIEVLRWVREESKCKGTTCLHARDLTREWQARCPTIADKGDVDHTDVEELLSQYEARSKQDPSSCGHEAESILKEGCGKDKTCLPTAESWATRCGKSDGTPLVVRMIERAVERKLPESKRVSLDTRSCQELQEEMREGIICSNQFECEESVRKLKQYKDRCEVDGARPTAQVALYQLAILAKAGQPTPPIPLNMETANFPPKEIPTALADSMGAILSVCDTRVKTPEEYLVARRACQDGKLLFVGVVKEQGDPRARLGRLDLPTDAILQARLPSMKIAGEEDLREKQALAALGPDLEKVAELAKNNPGEAISALFKVLQPHHVALRRSAMLRKSIAVRDEDFVPLFRELGKRKQAAFKGKIDRPMLLGFVTRARERLLADVTEAGEIELGGASAFDWLETADLLPRSTEALLTSMKFAIAQAKSIRIDRRTGDRARDYGTEQIQACAEGFKALSETQRGLIKCALGLDSCDEEKVQQIEKRSDESRQKVDEARHQLDLVVTGPGSPSREELREAASNAGCLVPWW